MGKMVKKNEEAAITIDRARVVVSEGFKTLAVAMTTADLSKPEVVADTLSLVREAKSIVESYDKTVKARVEEILKERGEVVTDKGSRRLGRLFMKPYRTGIDPKKFEALLRAKDLSPSKYMDQRVVYDFNNGKAVDAVKAKKISQEELDSCKYDESWVVETPKASEE